MSDGDGEMSLRTRGMQLQLQEGRIGSSQRNRNTVSHGHDVD